MLAESLVTSIQIACQKKKETPRIRLLLRNLNEQIISQITQNLQYVPKNSHCHLFRSPSVTCQEIYWDARRDV